MACQSRTKLTGKCQEMLPYTPPPPIPRVENSLWLKKKNVNSYIPLLVVPQWKKIRTFSFHYFSSLPTVCVCMCVCSE